MDAGELAELVESIRQHGVIEPIVVRASAFEPGKYEVIAGGRRTRASRTAGRTEIPAMVRDVNDAQLLELALQENLHRASMSPLDEARAIEKLQSLDAIYRDDRVVGSKIGRSETYVRDRKKLLKLAGVVQAALEGGAITAKHAERIARLPVDQHRAALEACFSWVMLSSEWDNDEDEPSIAELVDAGRWSDLASTLIGLRAFDEWAEEHAKVDLTDPAIQPLLEAADVGAEKLVGGETPEQIDQLVREAAAQLVQLSTDHLALK